TTSCLVSAPRTAVRSFFSAVPDGSRRAALGRQALGDLDDVLGRDAELLHDGRARRREAEAIDADDGSVEAHVARPGRGHRRLYPDALAARARQPLLAVGGRLAIEAREARHADDARPGPERLRRRERVLQLAARREQDELERRGL